MPRGMYNRKPASESLATTPTVLSHLDWWKELTGVEQIEVQNAGVKLASALVNLGRSRLAIGEHLEKIQGILEPKNCFGKFLKLFHFTPRTAYRYIRGYQHARASLPQPIMEAAMAKGLNMIGESENKPLGKYSNVIQMVPMPQRATPAKAAAFVERLEQVRKEQSKKKRKPRATNGNLTLERCFEFVQARYSKLPDDIAVRRDWVNRLVTRIQSLVRTRGRPRTQAAAA